MTAEPTAQISAGTSVWVGSCGAVVAESVVGGSVVDGDDGVDGSVDVVAEDASLVAGVELLVGSVDIAVANRGDQRDTGPRRNV
ncbi:hypothetical protein ATK17_3507 [Branchiibius hedensis]|uniref:Uncharacterized protein n=1 Tax=Branchiibius hedensis TaxID=672460 RepID=A0A2Y9A1P6_9MICO|nr:hypothetical protein ATK17_3507 [Branchiibius hedensis]SSA36127.1 hypothetical protein SAMN04489750_3507 [Branchiibius hedensis]